MAGLGAPPPSDDLGGPWEPALLKRRASPTRPWWPRVLGRRMSLRIQLPVPLAWVYFIGSNTESLDKAVPVGCHSEQSRGDMGRPPRHGAFRGQQGPVLKARGLIQKAAGGGRDGSDPACPGTCLGQASGEPSPRLWGAHSPKAQAAAGGPDARCRPARLSHSTAGCPGQVPAKPSAQLADIKDLAFFAVCISLLGLSPAVVVVRC